MTVGKFLERYSPLLMGAATLVCVAIWRNDIATQFNPNGWKTQNLYGAVFNWSSVQSGFVFGIYGFIVSKRDGFVGEIISSHSFVELSKYARRAYLTGFALTFASLPLAVADPSLADTNSRAFWFVAVWFAAFVWTFCAFLRVAFIFGAVVAVPDKRQRIAG